MSKTTNNAPERMTVFIGHGSPMNALADQTSGQYWREAIRSLGQKILPGKRAILCISAHWQTRGTEVFASAEPHMIHDLIGFPKELQTFDYPAPGAVSYAQALAQSLSTAEETVRYHDEWGYDHGVWSVLAQLAPEADIPLFMLSLDRRKTLTQHLAMAEKVGSVLPTDVLVVASGNIVHALAGMEEDPAAPPPPWAAAFDDRITRALRVADIDSIVDISREQGTADNLAVPTLEHYTPLVYAAGIAGRNAHVSFPYEGFEHSTISMRCVLFE
jgi:4,5-DOPA dioxygenase extradiol